VGVGVVGVGVVGVCAVGVGTTCGVASSELVHAAVTTARNSSTASTVA